MDGISNIFRKNRRVDRPHVDQSKFSKKDIAKATSVILGIQNKDVEIEATRIKNLCDRFAEIAYSMGETNDKDEYSEQMNETIYEAYQEVEKKQKEKKHKDKDKDKDKDED